MVKRSELNKHLTNTVLMRIDYIPISNENVDEINGKIAKELLIDGAIKFDQMKDTFIRAIDIKINDPSIQDFNEYINVKENSKIKAYEYFKINDGEINIKVIFNRQFTTIEINQKNEYQKYENYKTIFCKILEILKDRGIIINRFGFRKFNDIFFKEDTNIYEYINRDYFNLECDSLVNVEVENYITEKRFCFKKENLNINLITHTSQGLLNGNEIKRVAFDMDIYVNEIQELKKLFDDNEKEKFLDNINDNLFLIYKNLLTAKLLEILKTTSKLDDDNIIDGVEYNGEN